MFLSEVCEQSGKNGMTVSNVAIVFSPNLCWAKGSGPTSGKIPVSLIPVVLKNSLGNLRSWCPCRLRSSWYISATSSRASTFGLTFDPPASFSFKDLAETSKLKEFTEFTMENCGSIFANIVQQGYVETIL
jgi:hypothetical protein